MILSDSTEVHKQYNHVIQEIFPEGITSDNAEEIFNFCTADDEEKPVENDKGELKPTRQQAPYHSGYDVPPPWPTGKRSAARNVQNHDHWTTRVCEANDAV